MRNDWTMTPSEMALFIAAVVVLAGGFAMAIADLYPIGVPGRAQILLDHLKHIARVALGAGSLDKIEHATQSSPSLRLQIARCALVSDPRLNLPRPLYRSSHALAMSAQPPPSRIDSSAPGRATNATRTRC